MKACLNLFAGWRMGQTVLGSTFFTPPFKIADISAGRAAGVLELMLMNASPGVLDRDDYTLEITLAAQARLHLRTQAYQRIFQMQQGATQRMHVRVGKEAAFTYLPLPVVPHAGSIFFSENVIELSEGSVLIWGEVITCGRQNKGEVFRFTSYRSLTTILVDKKPVVRENLYLRPENWQPDAPGQLEGYTHQAGLMLIGGSCAADLFIGKAKEVLESDPRITFGISRLPVKGISVRILGFYAEDLQGHLQALADCYEECCVADIS